MAQEIQEINKYLGKDGLISLIDNIDERYAKKEETSIIVELNQDAYDALGDSVLTDGKTYFIKDAGIDGSARNVNFSNTVSKLSAVNVQDAIDELSSNLNNCFQSASDGKSLIASAITGKGIETDATATFETMANNIINIKTGDIELPDTITAGDTTVLSSSTLVYTCTSTSMTATGISVTIPRDGTYRFKFSVGRTNTSGTWTAQLYKNGTAISGATATWNQYQGTYTGDITCSAGDKIEIYARSRGTTYRAIISQLVACINWDNKF